MKLVDRLIHRLKNDKELILKLILTGSSRGLAAIGTFVFNFVLAQYLGIDDFGYFMLGYTILLGLGFLVRFGMGTAILRFAGIMYTNDEIGKILKLRKDVTVLCLGLGVLFGAILILSRNYIAYYFFDGQDVGGMLAIFGCTLPIFSFLLLQSSFFKAFKRPEIAPFFEIGLTAFLTSLLVILFSFLGFSINLQASSLFLFVSSILVFLVGSLTLTKTIKKKIAGRIFEKENYLNFYKSLPDYALAGVTGYLLKFSPLIFLGYFATGKDVGLFSIANSTAFLINFILWIVSAVYAPHFASLYSQGELGKLRGLIRSSTLYMLFVAVPIFLILVIFPEQILSLFGEEFVEAKLALIIMAFAQLFNVATGPIYFLLNMTGHERKLRNIVLLTGALTLVCSLILIPKYGYVGAAVTASIGLVMQNSIAFYISKKYIGISIL